jgi:hypothetical protein
LAESSTTTRGPTTSRPESLRIALFTDTFLPRIDGTATRLCHTIHHLRKLGREVLVVAPEGGLRDFEGARIYGVPGFPFPLYPELKLAMPRPLKKRWRLFART